jgi:transcriptional regulator with XRE-family HTH domain
MEHSPFGSDLEDFLDELWADARREGPDAVREIAFAEVRARLSSQFLVARQARGLTQAQLAQESGIDQAEISRIEAGQSNPTLKTLSSLTYALGWEVLLAPREGARRTAMPEAPPSGAKALDSSDEGMVAPLRLAQRRNPGASEIVRADGRKISETAASRPRRSPRGKTRSEK